MKSGYRGKTVSESVKRAAVQKFLSRGSRTVEEIAAEVGCSTWAIYHWAKEYGNSSRVKSNESGQRPQDRNHWERMRVVVEYDGLQEAERGEYLREHGLHSDTITPMA